MLAWLEGQEAGPWAATARDRAAFSSVHIATPRGNSARPRTGTSSSWPGTARFAKPPSTPNDRTPRNSSSSASRMLSAARWCSRRTSHTTISASSSSRTTRTTDGRASAIWNRRGFPDLMPCLPAPKRSTSRRRRSSDTRPFGWKTRRRRRPSTASWRLSNACSGSACSRAWWLPCHTWRCWLSTTSGKDSSNSINSARFSNACRVNITHCSKSPISPAGGYDPNCWPVNGDTSISPERVGYESTRARRKTRRRGVSFSLRRGCETRWSVSASSCQRWRSAPTRSSHGCSVGPTAYAFTGFTRRGGTPVGPQESNGFPTIFGEPPSETLSARASRGRRRWRWLATRRSPSIVGIASSIRRCWRWARRSSRPYNRVSPVARPWCRCASERAEQEVHARCCECRRGAGLETRWTSVTISNGSACHKRGHEWRHRVDRLYRWLSHAVIMSREVRRMIASACRTRIHPRPRPINGLQSHAAPFANGHARPWHVLGRGPTGACILLFVASFAMRNTRWSMQDKARRPEDVSAGPESGDLSRRPRQDPRWIKAALKRHGVVQASPNQTAVPGASTTDTGLERCALIASLLANPAVAVDIPIHQVPSLVAELTSQQAAILTALGMLTTRIVVQQPVPTETSDRLLTADEVAEALGVTKRWVQRRARGLPFARRLSEHAVRYSEGGLRRWMENRRMRVAWPLSLSWVAMAFNRGRGRIVLFGGRLAHGAPAATLGNYRFAIHTHIGRVMHWILFSAGAEFFVKGLCLPT